MPDNPGPIELAALWQAAANSRDVKALLALSDRDIEVAGPRGSGFGHQLLSDWVARAGLSLTPLRAFARGDTVVFEQRGIWRSLESGEVTGERVLASLYSARDGRIVKVARFDGLDAALAAGGLGPPDEVSRGGAA